MQLVAKCQDLRSLALCELCDRNTGPAGDDPLDLFFCHTLVYQGHILLVYLLLLDLQLLLQLRQLTVLQLRSLI